MEQRELYGIALSFRKAIMKTKRKREFYNRSDRMNYFPRGCCDDSADLFGYYLWEEYHIHSKQGNGIYQDDDPESITNHAFTILDDGTIIDLTADQFTFFSAYPDGVYVGPEICFYNNLDRKIKGNHCDITRNERLWHDYEAISKYL